VGLLVVAIVLAGCGGTSKEQNAGAGDAFATKALAVCQAALKQKQDWQPFPVSDFDPSDPDPSKFPQVSSWLTKEVARPFDPGSPASKRSVPHPAPRRTGQPCSSRSRRSTS